jgi:hypothetical protein
LECGLYRFVALGGGSGATVEVERKGK